jgi:vacuolar-type H+-ATPase subunit I/STV1
MSKRTLVAAILLILLSIGCYAQQSRYEEIKDLLNWYLDATLKMVNVIEMSQNTKEIAQALEDYVDATLEFVPQMEQFEEKYPELAESSDPPQELEATMERFEEVMGRAAEAFSGLVKFAEDNAPARLT